MARTFLAIAILGGALAAAVMFSSVACAGGADDWLALADAAGKGDLKTVRQLLVRGVKPDAPHPDHQHEYSPLDWSMIKGQLVIAKVLIEHHADINATDNFAGYTPLMIAANYGRVDSALFLLKHAAKIDLKDTKGRTALDWALASKNGDRLKVVKLLLDHGAPAETGAAVETATSAAASPTPEDAPSPPAPEPTLVQFVNSSSDSVTVSVDGAAVCTIQPGANCEIKLSGSDADAEHPVHADMSSNRSWDDKVTISECHWNWLGTKTYTFTNDKIPFECKR